MNPLDFATSLIAYCYATRGSVSSWGRTVKHNQEEGGHVESYHLQWLAGDVIYDEPVDLDRAEKLAQRHGLKLVRESDHDHLQAERRSP